MDKRTFALVGNPNSGKTTLFNALTGSNQFIGNWPGVTVEKKSGHLIGHPEITILDLPGLYSLAANSLEEIIASRELTQNPPDGIINIIDGTNLERNLYMTTQLLELGLPLVLAINMTDELKKEGLSIDTAKLSARFGCPVVAISALKGDNVKQLIAQLIQPLPTSAALPRLTFSTEIEELAESVSEIIQSSFLKNQLRYWGFRALEPGFSQNLSESQQKSIQELRSSFEANADEDLETVFAAARYEKISQLVSGAFIGKRKSAKSLSDRIDQVVTNRWLAIPIFVLVMVVVYGISVTTLGTYLTDWTNEVLFGEIVPNFVSSLLEKAAVAEWLQSLILDGIVAGVGAVLGFVPQMLILFFMLAVLEYSGYMARIAFIMDRAFRKWGLSGKSFIPLLIGSGCSVPGIMASRTIEEERDRRMTIILTSFIPCGAKLPVIALFAGAILGGALWVAPAAYFLGIVAVILSGLILKKTHRFTGEPTPFVMELPPYRLPGIKTLLRSTWERGWSFIQKAGTIILLSSIVIWALTRYGVEADRISAVEELSNSFLARVGSMISWVFSPLGWNSWQSAVASITGLVAKENVVNTFGILFGYAEVSEAGEEIWANVASHFGLLGGISFLIYNLLCIPCFAAVGAIRREMNNARWTWFTLFYQSVFAYLIAFVFYQIGSWIQNGQFRLETALAIAVSLGIGYLALRPAPENRKPFINKKMESGVGV